MEIKKYTKITHLSFDVFIKDIDKELFEKKLLNLVNKNKDKILNWGLYTSPTLKLRCSEVKK